MCNKQMGFFFLNKSIATSGACCLKMNENRPIATVCDKSETQKRK